MMKMMKILSISLFLSLFCIGAFAGETSEIVLTDGTTIYGEIVSFANGVYQLKSGSLGIIEVKESDIKLVRVKPEASKKTVPTATETKKIEPGSEIKSLQQTMMNNAELMGLILSLQDDPEIQKILADPDIMNAISSGDMTTLMSNPKILGILSHPRVQEIRSKLSQTGGNPK